MVSPLDSVSLARQTGGESRSTVHLMISGPDLKEHTPSFHLIAAAHLATDGED
jgi:hypothetical protein